MIAVLKNTATKEQIASLISWFEDKGLKVNESKGEYCTVLGLIGDTSTVDIDMQAGHHREGHESIRDLQEGEQKVPS